MVFELVCLLRKGGEDGMLDAIHYVVLSLDLFSALMLILIFFSNLFEKNKNPLLKNFMTMTGACAFSLLMESISILFFFSDYPKADLIRTAINNLAIIGGYVLSLSYASYVAHLVGPNRKLCQAVQKSLRVLSVVAAVFLIVGGFSGQFFTFDHGATTPGPFFIGLFAFDIGACLAGILLIILYARTIRTKDVVALMTLPLFIFISASVQYISFRMMYGLFFMAGMSLFIIYLMIQTDRNRRSLEQEKQLMDMNIAVMYSQIQPHFLYNALSSIRRLIKKDPEVAATAVEKFSAYLRQNLESMSRVEPIPFSTELEHLQEYLYLEKLRFGERLHVEYNIGYADFVMPVLSLQPIVENAVKHGVLKKEEGGCVWITTRREGGHVILTVMDNGVGFHPDHVAQDGKTHVGFENVRRRIEMQCKGTVTVESTIGAGTTVTITMPLI